MNETLTPRAPAPERALRRPRAVIEREKRALAAHRAAMRGWIVPAQDDAPKGTFLHGFFLPFSLIVATMRDAELRGPYLRVALLRGLIVTLVAVVAVAGGKISASKTKEHGTSGVVIHHSRGSKVKTPLRVDMPGLHVDIDEEHDNAEVTVLGKNVPVAKVDADDAPVAAPAAVPEPPPTLARTVLAKAADSWKWLLALVTFLSAMEFIVVFFSRRWDDWLSFHASRLAAIKPEDDAPKTPKIALDIPWLYRKMKRRVRGYVVFFAGFPALLPLRVVPVAGAWLFPIAVTLWGWYWLGVFSAAKSAHAWADEEQALSPAPIRALTERVPGVFVLAPLRWYGRWWAKLTSGVNPAATTFERSPAAFLGLALARVILSLPGIYLLARPIVPVAAGRLCAETHPQERFSILP